MKRNPIYFHIPEDQALLAALGEITLRNEHLNYALKLLIKSLADITVEEAIAATEYESSRQLRERAKKLAKQKLGEGTALLKLQAILSSCKNLTDKRNELVHGIWAKELDGDAHIRDAYGNEKNLPSTTELISLAKEIESLTNQLNLARAEGFLYEALIEKTKN